MEELPVDDPGHMASAERQLRDWEQFILGKILTNDISSEEVCQRLTVLPLVYNANICGDDI